MSRNPTKSALPYLIIGIFFASIILATAFFGWPKNVEAAGPFAEFVGALLAPASLVLVVLSLDAQARAERRATENHFLGLQVQALIALIEDDRYKLKGMASETGDKKHPAFMPTQRRYASRVQKLNHVLRNELKLPGLASEEEGAAG